MVPLAPLLAFVPCVQAQTPPTPPLEPNGDSLSPSISDDGKFVVFESRASNFVPGDQKDTWDVFLYERESGVVTLISDDEPLAARAPVISGDGRWIAFLQSLPARAITPAKSAWERASTEHPWKVGLHDRKDGSLRWLGEAQPTYDLRYGPQTPSISRDGGKLVLTALQGGVQALQMYDAAKQQRTAMDLSNDGKPLLIDVTEPAISRSGRFLTFTTAARNLAATPVVRGTDAEWFNFHPEDRNIFRRDLETGRNEYVSHLGFESLGYMGYSHSLVSDDGRYVAYDHNDPRKMGATHVGFVSDLEKQEGGRLLPVGKGDYDWQGGVSTSWLSADGRHALVDACYAPIPILPPPQDSDVPQVLLRDLDPLKWLLISRSADGKPGNRESGGGVANQDMSVIAFSSGATNLVAGDSNRCSDILLFEPSTNRMTRIVPNSSTPPASPNPDSPTAQPNGDTRAGQMSEDGQYVVFASQASNFDDQDSGDSWDVFLLTCATGVVKRLSLEPHEMVSCPAISGDGSCIAYWSTNDVRSDENWVLRLIERSSGTLKSVEGLKPTQFGMSPDPGPSISRDGSRLVFEASGVAKLYDRRLDTTSIVSIGSDGSFKSGAAGSPTISSDGRVVAFWSQSSKFAPWPISEKKNAMPDRNDTNVFVRDLEKQTTLAANDFFATLGVRGSCFEPRLTEDGSRMAFNFFNRPSDGSHCGFVVEFGREVRPRLLSLGKYASGFTASVGITWLSSDGKTVLVSSRDEGLFKPGAEAHSQVFLHQMDGDEWIPISRNAAGEFANRPAEGAVASRDLSRIVFESEADNLVPGDTNNARDIFIVDRKTGKISRVEVKH